MTKKRVKKAGNLANKKPDTQAFIDGLEKSGKLNPEHRVEFGKMLDDVAPPLTKKK